MHANVKSAVWYDNMPLGNNTIDGMTKVISKQRTFNTAYKLLPLGVHHHSDPPCRVEAERMTIVIGHRNTLNLKPYKRSI